MRLNQHFFIIALSVAILPIAIVECTVEKHRQILDHNVQAQAHFNEDAQWYLDNIPFFECSDKQIEQVYYYRWKMFKAHIRNVGDNSFVITEFINHVPWDREPYCTINAASMLHIYEGRWLKDDRYINGYINNLYQHGGNNRQYSEGIADAAYARYLVNMDTSFIIAQLDSMKHIYNGWYDHYDSTKQLYYIPAMPDATEYTIASIDASGGKDGFAGGDAFRPTFNSYMYGNAMAISAIAALKGDTATNIAYAKNAKRLCVNVMRDLWNDSLQHFTDRFKQDNQYVHYWDFIRGRELAGMAPWFYNLPADSAMYSKAWKHVTDTTALLGRFGLRTNEPSYQYYFTQFTYSFGQRGSQWNGPSWPYQTSQTITGMANLLNNYNQAVVTNADYIKLLRLFSQQHFLTKDKIDLVENYDPNLGGPIVYYYWSNHYNHSAYNNLIISGLCGIRPSESDTLVINPLVDNSIAYYCLDNVSYHGHTLTVMYDRDGNHYHQGKGLTVWVDGKKATLIDRDNKPAVIIGQAVVYRPLPQPVNYALNLWHRGYPVPSASINTVPDSSLYQAVDGRIWYLSEITNQWTTERSTTPVDWYALDFGGAHTISGVNVYLVADAEKFAVPDSIAIDYKEGNEQWHPVKIKQAIPGKLTGNAKNSFQFDSINAEKIKVSFWHGAKAVAVSEVECY